MSKPASLVILFALTLAATGARTASLTPKQQSAIETMMSTMDAETRVAARPELERLVSSLGDYEIDLMLASLAAQENESSPAPVTQDSEASPEDLQFNRAQYEPALRTAWQASRRFDELVDASLASQCPTRDVYAVYGSAWRYEVFPLQPGWTRASNNADLDVEILGASYAPQDGRYEFDFSSARNDFDTAAVERAVTEACDAYRKVGESFIKEARSRMSDDGVKGGFELEQSANARASTVRAELEEKLHAQAPTGNLAVINALLTGKRLN